MDSFCCLHQNDIINNPNFLNSYNSKETEDKYHSIKKGKKERLPSSQIKLGFSANIENSLLKSTSKIPITSKNVIIKKWGDPMEDYEIIGKLGEGTYGKVYKVKNKHNNAIRAMKKIAKYWVDKLDDNEVMKEIEILKNLNHPYIIKLFEYYVKDDYIYLINELCDEGDLQGKIRKIKKFPEFIVKIIMLQVFKALMYLNEKRIIHGDLKLENILVESYENNGQMKSKDKDGFIEAINHDMKVMNGTIKLVDSFNTSNTLNPKDINNLNKKLNEKHQREDINIHGTGFRFRAKKADKDENKIKNEIKDKESKNIYNSQTLRIFNYGIKLIDFGCSKMFTRTKRNFNDVVGTLVYCSPEVLSNNYNEMCDIWSCGVLMYCLLCGYFPFMGSDEEEIIKRILSGKFEFDVEDFNGISYEAKDLITRCLKYEPSKRITIQEALNHRFFNDLKKSNKFTDNEIQTLHSLKGMNKYTKFDQLILTYLSYNFTDNKLLNELSRLYDKLDQNNDYKITKAELYKAYKEAKIPITQKELDGIIKSIDFDNNGNIDYEEFIRMCIPKEKLFTAENLENAFLLFDKDKKGFITPDEIIDFIQSNKKIDNKVKQKMKDEILEIADEIIDVDEFKLLMMIVAERGN